MLTVFHISAKFEMANARLNIRLSGYSSILEQPFITYGRFLSGPGSPRTLSFLIAYSTYCNGIESIVSVSISSKYL